MYNGQNRLTTHDIDSKIELGRLLKIDTDADDAECIVKFLKNSAESLCWFLFPDVGKDTEFWLGKTTWKARI
jgi:hypothetical protein